ncbi:hypothetical protein EV647_2255 [Kribbella sp. VKM Ac-2566]|nr:hypothetical protein EV647_2255 [Kribbella sp. VKM Ac-2566]
MASEAAHALTDPPDEFREPARMSYHRSHGVLEWLYMAVWSASTYERKMALLSRS